jgi:hypothetical protein
MIKALFFERRNIFAIFAKNYLRKIKKKNEMRFSIPVDSLGKFFILNGALLI